MRRTVRDLATWTCPATPWPRPPKAPAATCRSH